MLAERNILLESQILSATAHHISSEIRNVCMYLTLSTFESFLLHSQPLRQWQAEVGQPLLNPLSIDADD